MNISNIYRTNEMIHTILLLLPCNHPSDLNHHTVKISKPYNSPDLIITKSNKNEQQSDQNHINTGRNKTISTAI
jgi:hypothetical protein